jgi:hypothetical protein
MVELEAALRSLGRTLELRPDDRRLAQQAFGAASAVRALRGDLLR